MDRLLTIPETCARLHHGRTRVYELIRSGRLPSVLVGPQARRVRESDLNAFIAGLDASDAASEDGEADLDQRIAELVARAPRMTPEQAARLRRLFNPPAKRGASG
jgi:excisionase family DNA binding protein